MKILIAGAGIGGLYFAGLMSKQGHTVYVYEKSKDMESMRYPWHDDVNPSVFRSLTIPIPKNSYPKLNWTFFSPFDKGRMALEQKKEYIDRSIDRQELNEILYGMRGKAKVFFSHVVERALVEQNRVVGLKIKNLLTQESFEEKSDLVIDCAGVFSTVRESLPSAFGIPSVNKESIFFVERSFYKAKENVPYPQDTNKVYLKHIGQKGISWCIASKKGFVDVLIGRVGMLDEEGKKEAFDALQASNPVLSNEMIQEGKDCAIPVRRPLSKMVASGYAGIGDSVCLTVPMIGSGIATSLYSAKILADVLAKNNSVEIGNLWKYQVEVLRRFGAEHYAVETMKNWLLDLDNESITWFLTSGILTNADLQRVSIGKPIRLSFPDVLHKGYVGMKAPKVFMSTVKMLVKGTLAKWRARSVPKKYNENRVHKWQKKADRCFE